MTIESIDQLGKVISSPALFSFKSPYSMIINSTALTDVGPYKFKVTIFDGYHSASLTQELQMFNTPPYYIDLKPTDQSIKLNNSFIYPLPEFRDDERNPIYILLEPAILYEFTKIEDGKLIMYPNDWKYLKSYKVKVVLTDTLNSTNATFRLKVTNSPPYFNRGGPKG